MSEQLKPCPFCGGQAEIRPRTTWTPEYVECYRTCGASAYSVAAWNRRAPSPSAIVAALEKERARWYAHHLNDNPFDGGYTSGLTKAIDIVKELSK